MVVFVGIFLVFLRHDTVPTPFKHDLLERICVTVVEVVSVVEQLQLCSGEIIEVLCLSFQGMLDTISSDRRPLSTLALRDEPPFS